LRLRAVSIAVVMVVVLVSFGGMVTDATAGGSDVTSAAADSEATAYGPGSSETALPGGGTEVLTALATTTGRVTVIEPNELVYEALTTDLGEWAGLADDPAFVGYPYPLARAHQAARVTGYDVVDVRRAFRDALGRRGMSQDDVEVLFQDFHEVLNR